MKYAQFPILKHTIFKSKDPIMLSRLIYCAVVAMLVLTNQAPARAGSDNAAFVVDGAEVVGGALGSVSLILDPILTTLIQDQQARILLEIRDLDDPLAQNDTDISFAIYSGLDLDGDPSNDFSGSETFEIDPLTLTPAGDPISLFTPGTITAGDLVAGPATIPLPIPGFGGTLDNFIMEASVASGAGSLISTGFPISIPAVLFENIPAPAPLPGNLLDYLNFFGINPDVDLDMDGTNESFSAEVALTAVSAELQIPVLGTSFVRGDLNGDGSINVTDATVLLDYLFVQSLPQTCAMTADINGDGSANVTDPINLLQFLFQGGTQPAAPFPDCGLDTQSTLDCTAFAACP